MRLTLQLLRDWRANLAEVWPDDYRNGADVDALVARAHFYDFEEEAALLVEALSRQEWRGWLCAEYGEEDPKFGGPQPHIVESHYLFHGQLRPCLIVVLKHRVTFYVEEPGMGGLVAYPFLLDFRNHGIEAVWEEVKKKTPEVAFGPEAEKARDALEQALRWLTECAYGSGVWHEEEPPPIQPLFVNARAADEFIRAREQWTTEQVLALYGPVFRVALCTLSLLWADRERVHVQAERTPARTSRLHNRAGRRELLPERRVVRYTLLREVVRDRVETGEVRAERERRKCRDHEVVAHWRRLRSGRVVPVKGHRRGDPSLGSVQKVYRVTPPPKIGEGESNA